MKISYRTARNLSISVMMAFIFVLGSGSIFMYQFIRHLHLDICKKIAHIESLIEIDEHTKQAISNFESLDHVQTEDIESIVTELDFAIKKSHDFEKNATGESERQSIDRYRKHANLFRAALFSYAEELNYDPGGSGAKELARIIATVKYETHMALVKLMAMTRSGIRATQIRIDEMLAYGQKTSFALAIIGVAIGLFIAFFLTSVLNQPIRRLVDATQQIVQGDLTHRVDIDDVDEIGHLADAFNQMTENLKKVQGQLVISEKMAALGQLSAGVAHEINNPTSYVTSNLGALQDNFADLVDFLATVENAFVNDLEDLDRWQQLADKFDLAYLKSETPVILQQSLEGTQRVQQIVATLKEYAHPGNGNEQFLDIDINENIDKALSLVHNQIKYHCKLEKDFEQLPPVSAKPNKLQQVFINLLVNAAQAIENEGIISIKTRIQDGHVHLLFSDTGKGIPETQINRIFDPFFTTKEVGQGTGLGLAISYRIIEEHNGKIHVESEVNRGTRFCIELPVRS